MTVNKEKKVRGYGLIGTPNDGRDFSFESVFGSAHLQDIPRSFVVSKPLRIKDQGFTDMCTAYALTAVSEDQEGILLDPFITFALTKAIMGGDPLTWGADLRSACKSALYKKGGFIPAGLGRFKIELTANEEDRNYAAKLRLSGKQLETAKKYAKQSFFAVKGSGDVFENIRSALWLSRSEKRSVFAGIDWHPSWNRAEGGVIGANSAPRDKSYLHALKLYGVEGDYMFAQLSNGENIGGNGIFMIHRDVLNVKVRYESFIFRDMPRENAEYKLGRISIFRYWLKLILS